jgi:hypothetical protein
LPSTQACAVKRYVLTVTPLLQNLADKSCAFRASTGRRHIAIPVHGFWQCGGHASSVYKDGAFALVSCEHPMSKPVANYLHKVLSQVRKVMQQVTDRTKLFHVSYYELRHQMPAKSRLQLSGNSTRCATNRSRQPFR